MQIPDEAVQIVAERMLHRYGSGSFPSHLTWRDFADDARADLEAAAPILAEAWKPKPRARTPKREVLARCQWCFKHNRTASEYEQRGLNGVWHRLCVRCANRRLGNPWNALLPMRKIGSEENDSAPAGAVKEDGGP